MSASLSRVSADRSGGSSTSEKLGLMSIRPKSSRLRPPSLASAPTIWRGSTRWRLPTAIRQRTRSPGGLAALARLLGGRLGHVLEEQRLPVLREYGDRGGDVLGRHVVLLLVGLHQLAEDPELRVAQRLADRLGELRDPEGVDVLDRGQAHLLERGPVGLLDRAQQVVLARGDERDRLAAATGAARAADAVHVGLGVGGDVVVDHVADPLDVETAGGDVGGDEDVELALAQLVDGALALHLGDVAVDRRRREPAGAQPLGQVLGGVLGADEDDHPVEVLDLEDAGEGVELLRVRDLEVALRRRWWPCSTWT